MTRLQMLRNQARELRAKIDAALKAAVGEDGVPRVQTDEERTAYDADLATLQGLATQIRSEEDLAAISNPPADAGDTANAGGNDDEDRDDNGDTEIRVGTDRWLSAGFESLGDQMIALRNAAGGTEPDKRLLHINATNGRPERRVASGQSETVPSDGGFQLQHDFVTAIKERMHAGSQILPLVNFTPISQNATGLKFNAIKEDSRVDGSRGGGVRAYWTDEAEEMTKSKAKMRQVNMNLSELTALLYATDGLLADAPALTARSIKGFGEELQFKTEDAFFEGDGSGKPLGVQGHPGTVSIDAEDGQAANTIVPENIVKMWARMRNRNNSVWMINQDIEPQLNLMSLAVGTGGTAVYLPGGSIAGQQFTTLMGRPVIPIEYAETLGTVGDITLCDWAAYEAIDKGAPKQDSSIHVRFLFNETTFRAIYRVDGQPLYNLPLTPFKGTTTQAHFINLATRS